MYAGKILNKPEMNHISSYCIASHQFFFKLYYPITMDCVLSYRIVLH